ncbi:MAG: hypothetical protein ACT4RN_01445 [Pseudonocardia sp.]
MTKPVSGPLDQLAAELAVAQAAAAARSGDLDRAQQLLADGATPATAAVLDLRARVHAQRGDLAAADACWAGVQELEPDDPGARAGRALVAEVAAGRRRPRRRAAAALVAVAAVAVLGLGAGLAVRALDAPGAPPAVTPAAPSQVPAPSAAETLAGALTSPGWQVDARPDGVGVRFDATLFARSDRLTPAGAAVLADLGALLRGRDVTVSVVGHAVAVPGGPTSGGSLVGMARALVASRELATAGGLPLTSFTLSSADQSAGPAPDAAGNRTVTLVIMPR